MIYTLKCRAFFGFVLVAMILMLTVALSPIYAFEKPTGFSKINSKECTSINDDVIARLPKEWLRYKGFTKVCELKGNNAPTSTVYLVSIWVDDYLLAKYPNDLKKWERFPLPILIDSEVRQLGQLPEIFPSDEITSSDVFYGRWIDGVPGEIRMDVYNPAVGGDYYYRPLVWDAKTHRYYMRDSEVKHGKRPN